MPHVLPSLIMKNFEINNEEIFVAFGNEHFKSKSVIYVPEILKYGLYNNEITTIVSKFYVKLVKIPEFI